MKKYLVLWLIPMGMATTAFAGPTFSPCVTGSLTSYINISNTVGGCTIGNDLFDDFAFINVNVLSNPVTADNITVTPVIGPNGPTVTFTGNFTAGGLVSVAEYLLGFEVTALNQPAIDFASVKLSETGSVSQNLLTLLPTGSAAVAEVDCYGGLLELPTSIACLGGGLSVGATAQLGTGVNVSANVNIPFAPQTFSLGVIKDITLAADLGGSASISSITQAFTTAANPNAPTPEPASFFLGGCGLVALGLLRRRKPKNNVISIAESEKNRKHHCLLH